MNVMFVIFDFRGVVRIEHIRETFSIFHPMKVMFVIFDLLILGAFVRHVTYFSSFPITIVTVFKGFIFNVFFGFLLFSSCLSLLFCSLIIIAVFFFLLLL